jgi:hypothetical protein
VVCNLMKLNLIFLGDVMLFVIRTMLVIILVCFGHALSKACQYATIDNKVVQRLTYVSIKLVQAYIQKCITLPKKFGKGRQMWETCIDFGLRPIKLNTPIKIRYMAFISSFAHRILINYIVCKLF